MPRVHRVMSLLNRWLMGTHQGAVSHQHLDYYLDEFTFRFNRRRSRSRGKIFFRLVQQAVNIEPVPYVTIIQGQEGTQHIGEPESREYPTLVKLAQRYVKSHGVSSKPLRINRLVQSHEPHGFAFFTPRILGSLEYT